MSLLRGTHAWNETGTGTTSGATVIHQDTNLVNTHLVASMAVSGDTACVVTIESPAGTVLWRARFAAAFDRYYTFPPKVIRSASASGLIQVKISASSANCEATINGYTIQ
jgi:hypothetical protein